MQHRQDRCRWCLLELYTSLVSATRDRRYERYAGGAAPHARRVFFESCVARSLSTLHAHNMKSNTTHTKRPPCYRSETFSRTQACIAHLETEVPVPPLGNMCFARAVLHHRCLLDPTGLGGGWAADHPTEQDHQTWIHAAKFAQKCGGIILY